MVFIPKLTNKTNILLKIYSVDKQVAESIYIMSQSVFEDVGT